MNLTNAPPLLDHSELALFAQRTRIPTSARSIGFCVVWVCRFNRWKYKAKQDLLGEMLIRHGFPSGHGNGSSTVAAQDVRYEHQSTTVS